MLTIFGIIAFLIFICRLYNLKSKIEDSEFETCTENFNDNEPNQEKQMSNEGKQMSNEEMAKIIRDETRNLMVNALNNLGCQPEVLDNESVHVIYQGENFTMNFSGSLVHVWDPFWLSININDPEWPNVREAVNRTNFNFGPTIVTTPPDENGEIHFHSHYGMLMQDGIKDIDNYVRQSLNMFFRTKHGMSQNIQHLRVEQQQRQNNRRPIGFQSNSEEENN